MNYLLSYLTVIPIFYIFLIACTIIQCKLKKQKLDVDSETGLVKLILICLALCILWPYTLLYIITYLVISGANKYIITSTPTTPPEK